MKNSDLNKSRKNVLIELNNAFQGILHNYKYLNKLSLKGEEVIPSAEWLLDNIYLIEKEYKTIKKNLPRDYFENLTTTKLENDTYPRVYILAKQYINKNQDIIREDELIKFVNEYGNEFTIGEIWAFPLMLRITLILSLAEIINTIVITQKQRAGAKEFAHTVIKYEEKNNIESLLSKLENKYPLNSENATKDMEIKEYMGDDESLHDGLFSAEFANKFFTILKDNSIDDKRIYRFVLDRLNINGNTEDNLEKEIIKEQIKEGKLSNLIGVNINSLRIMDSINWKEFFKNTSKVEEILMKDPAKVYENMDFESKDYYRHKIEEISRQINVSESEIVEKALDLSIKDTDKTYRNHIGYYIVDDGLDELLSCFFIKKDINKKKSQTSYITTIILSTILLNIFIVTLIYFTPIKFDFYEYILGFILILIPSSEVVIALYNYYLLKITKVSFIPKLEYKEGIGKENKTIVVIPAIISNSDEVIKLMKKLEIYYLGNKDKNIYYALLGDLQDSDKENEDSDKEINNEGIKFTVKLNEKYRKDFNNNENRFFFLNRKRLYNESENIYMGYERKRGKIMEFMALLKGDNNTSYNLLSSSIEKIKDSKYIITLDSDTFLPLGSAKRLIGAMSHILNIPYVENNKVIRGYSVMQPKVSVDLENKHKTYFSEIFAGDAGVDAYSTASSDIYQDLFKEGIFTGKGIIEIDSFYNILKDEIKENKILSHDLIEGILTRCALVSDIEVIDTYPTSYLSSALRLHRWVRGDFQISSYLFKGKLSPISKWKIFDNLRRSLLAPSIILALFSVLTIFRGAIQIGVLLFLALIIPVIFTITDFVVTPKKKLMGTFKNLKQIILIISFIPYQAYLMSDAIIRSLYRMIISKKYLLQWKTAEKVENSIKNNYYYYYSKMWIGVFIAFMLLIVSFSNSIEIIITMFLLTGLWILSPAIACKISKEKIVLKDRLELDDEEFLRDITRRIFAYYEDFINEENNYLAPDNYQESPYKGIAYRTSPTNIGMGLISNLVAYDMGYLSIGEMIYKLEMTIDNMNELEKYKGHYLNWYDTKSKNPLWPKYVSTVDSGNLLGYLWIIKEEIENLKNKDVIREKEILSLKDTYKLIREVDKIEIYDSIPDNINLKEYKFILENELKNISLKLDELSKLKEENKTQTYWLNKLKNEVEIKLDFYNFIFEGIEKIVIDYFKNYKSLSLNEILNILEDIKASSGNEFKEVLNKRIYKLNEFIERVNNLSLEINKIMKEMKFDFLFNEDRGLFSIGYNVEEHSLGNSYYDLMASEARIASFLAIARGEIKKDHWYNLSRNMTKAFGEKSLVSWSGTMFEYFMPYQIMKSFDNTIWDLTYSSVINAQKIYGEKKGVPWGISESAYYEFDIAKNYQYKAFGVPGVGLKRGLEEELVISPYSTIMALPYNMKLALSNLKELYRLKAYGRYGFIEAIDYSKGIENKNEVRCYMVHHLGMSLLALDNVINNNIFKERFHKIPEVKATEILLKEKIPEYIVYDREVELHHINNKVLEKEIFVPRIFNNKKEKQEILLLSNGSYSTMINNNGSGYSKKDDMTIYRWKGDSTSDSSGMFFYIKNLNSNDYWSASYEPCKENNQNYIVEFTLDKASFERKDGNIKTKYEVMLCSEDNVEIRKITLKNISDKRRTLEVTSYLEVTLQSFEGDAVHPSFSNLFISTEYNDEGKALIGNRRARAEGAVVPYIFHSIVAENNLDSDITYETSRLNFIGRNRSLKSPKVMDNDTPLLNTVGTVLDPIMSLRASITLDKNEEKTLYYLTGVSESKESILELIYKYKDINIINKQVDTYNYYTQLQLKHIGIRSNQANIYQKFAKLMIYINDERKNREEYIKNINMSQENLWPYGISGDLPIILLKIYNEDDIDLLRQTLNMHYYFKTKGIKSDLIIYNDEEISYEEPLQKNIIGTIKNSLEKENINKSGGIFIHNKSTMKEEVKDFIIGIANLYIDSKDGNLSNQLIKFEEENNISEDISYINRIKGNVNKNDYIKIRRHKENSVDEEYNLEDIIEAKNNSEYLEESINNLKESLDFYNGYGGFDKEDKSYVISLKNYENTPAPWINVISNKDFGFHISEVGSMYTWCGNSRENKITPWNNDWVMDQSGEVLYIRDNDRNKTFTITPMPIRDKGEYIIKHSFGYSTFSHTAYKIKSEMQIFCSKNEKLKICKIKLTNLSDKERSLSLVYYAQLVLGVHSYNSAKYISTNIKDNYIYGNNPYSKYFGKLKAYLSINGDKNQSFTGDRKSFIGNGGNLSNPKALSFDKLNNKCGSIYDPCLASVLDINLKEKEEKEITILFGEEESETLIEEKIEKYSNIDNVYKALEEIKDYWSNFLGNIQVKTPDLSMDYLLNGWLMYQTLSCRYLSRTAFYQSGGAYGFRDQLQDSMALGILDSNITREQILRSASRQYLEGDVQHWWHPVINSGIRTRFSDDLLWLPYVTAEYIKKTGDYTILDEEEVYLEDEPLREGEDERYTIVNNSTKTGTIYEHCLKAIDKALKFGEHNIPLMGSGDWNDGMSTVGNKGKGESVWVGWFLYSILDNFIEICSFKDDKEKEEEYIKFKEFIKENLEKNAWDGGWYRRAYFDNGKPLGSRDNDECKIDSIAQSWSIISKAGKEARVKEAMEAVDKYLVDKDNGLIKLLSPPFDKSLLEPGYIKGYVPGVRENGGQYTHAAVWVILALTKLNLGDKAWKYYNMINPINHSNTELEARRYKVEPYVMAADVYIKEPHGGRGGWSWYTGASGWMYKVGIEDILGLKKIENKGYIIEPCIPNSWSEYEIKIKNEKEDYNIKIIRNNKEKGLYINNEKVINNIIPRNKGKLQIEVVL